MAAILKKSVNEICPHCLHKIKRAWVIRYESPGLNRLVYLCTRCEHVIKTESEQHRIAVYVPPTTALMRLV